MNIRLKDIGIVSDSTIELNGLTVITGHNNSGKTTVGKVLYSLVDAVSNIENKAASDKYSYVLEQLKNANREFSCRMALKRGIEKIEVECIRIFFLEDYRESIGRDDIETFLVDLLSAIQDFSIEEEPYKTIIEEDISSYLFNERLDADVFLHEKENCLFTLKETFEQITRDPELIKN